MVEDGSTHGAAQQGNSSTVLLGLVKVEHKVSDREAELVRGIIGDARAPATRRAYASDVRRFVYWCTERGMEAFPATTTTMLLHLLALVDGGRALATVERALISIGLAQVLAGGENPRHAVEVREFMKGLRRRMRTVRKREAPPLMLDDLRRLVATQTMMTRIGVRNRALLVVGWFGAMRRSEIVGLNRTDVRVDHEGVVVVIRSSKTDQAGQGAIIGLPRRRDDLCPAAALRAWLAVREDDNPALFVALDRRRHGQRLAPQGVERVMAIAAAAANVEVHFTPHSLRAGFATQAARAGKPAHAIRRQTRHRSLAMLERYIREGEVFVGNPAADL